jgi:hypothetical protein
MANNRYPPEGSSSRDAKVAIPRIPGHGYHMPPATRTPRVRSEVVGKAVSNASCTIGPVLTPAPSVLNAVDEVGPTSCPYRPASPC